MMSFGFPAYQWRGLGFGLILSGFPLIFVFNNPALAWFLALIGLGITISLGG